MVKFVWWGLLCCGVVNGLVYSCVGSPEKYFYMLGVLVVCCILLVVHYCSTKKWCVRKNDDSADYDEDHPRVFINSFLLSFVLLVIACITGYMGCIVALATMMLTFVVAAVRESLYTY